MAETQSAIFNSTDLNHAVSMDFLREAHELKMKYFLKEILGSGMSSTVYRAIEKRTGDEFAIKIVDIAGEHGDAVAELVKKETLREIDILAMCDGNDHIIHLYEYFYTATNIFMVLELCRYGELFDHLTQMISLSERKVRILMEQVFEAVEYMHERNIVHRDLKPENMLLIDDVTVKVSDFGFGIILEDNQQLTDLCGTPSYLAPEVLARSMYEDAPGYGKEVDMWACGVIMYTLLSGSPPFWNRRQMIMLRSIMNADYNFNNHEWQDVSAEAKNLIEQLLVTNPQERLTAREALAHSFFHCSDSELYQSVIRSKRYTRGPDLLLKAAKINKFRVVVYCVIFLIIRSRSIRATDFDVERFQTDPYSIKMVRKLIDTAAFTIYRHWVKNELLQNRAALFSKDLPCIDDMFLSKNKSFSGIH